SPVMDPLPNLRPGDLRGGGILHEVRNRHRPGSPEPRFQVLDRDPYVAPQARLGRLAAGNSDIEEVARRHVHIVPRPAELIRPPLERGVEDLLGHRDPIRMGDPGAIETIVHIARVVLADLRYDCLVSWR